MVGTVGGILALVFELIVALVTLVSLARATNHLHCQQLVEAKKRHKFATNTQKNACKQGEV